MIPPPDVSIPHIAYNPNLMPVNAWLAYTSYPTVTELCILYVQLKIVLEALHPLQLSL